MKDVSHTSGFNITQTAMLLPIMALMIIITGLFLVNSSMLAQAQESADVTRISADIDESYFSSSVDSETDAKFAQSGKLEKRDRSTDNDEVTVEEVDTEDSSCPSPYIEDDLRIDFDNDSESVLKLQSFLKTYEGFEFVELNGTFDEATLEAVQAFQTRYAEDVLEPWGYLPQEATGYVYITTKKKINEIHCDQQFSLTPSQQEEIREYRQLLNSLRAQGASFEVPNYLAEYYATQSGMETPAGTVDDDGTDDVDDVDETDNSDADEAAGTTTATSSEEDGDDRGFFQRLFGIGGDDPSGDEAGDDATTSTSTDTDETDTDEEPTDNEGDEEPTDAEQEDESATSSATSSSVDGVAAGVYNGVNSILNFLLSPTFLLIVLVVLILLLIATIIEGGDEDESDADGDVDPWAEYDEAEPVTPEEEEAAAELDNAVDAAAADKAPTPPSTDEDTETSAASEDTVSDEADGDSSDSSHSDSSDRHNN